MNAIFTHYCLMNFKTDLITKLVLEAILTDCQPSGKQITFGPCLSVNSSLKSVLCRRSCAYHQQPFISVDDPKPNGHVGVFAVLQDWSDGDISARRVRLQKEKREIFGLRFPLHSHLSGT